MGGVSKEEQDKLLGIEGLESLCRTYGSADYLEKAMRDWSDDVVSTPIPMPRSCASRTDSVLVLPGHLGRAAGSCSARWQHWHPHRCVRRGTHLQERRHKRSRRVRSRRSFRRNGFVVRAPTRPQRANHHRDTCLQRAGGAEAVSPDVSRPLRLFCTPPEAATPYTNCRHACFRHSTYLLFLPAIPGRRSRAQVQVAKISALPPNSIRCFPISAPPWRSCLASWLPPHCAALPEPSSPPSMQQFSTPSCALASPPRVLPN